MKATLVPKYTKDNNRRNGRRIVGLEITISFVDEEYEEDKGLARFLAQLRRNKEYLTLLPCHIVKFDHLHPLPGIVIIDDVAVRKE